LRRRSSRRGRARLLERVREISARTPDPEHAFATSLGACAVRGADVFLGGREGGEKWGSLFV
jgi:hypothetical protein